MKFHDMGSPALIAFTTSSLGTQYALAASRETVYLTSDTPSGTTPPTSDSGTMRGNPVSTLHAQISPGEKPVEFHWSGTGTEHPAARSARSRNTDQEQLPVSRLLKLLKIGHPKTLRAGSRECLGLQMYRGPEEVVCFTEWPSPMRYRFQILFQKPLEHHKLAHQPDDLLPVHSGTGLLEQLPKLL